MYFVHKTLKLREFFGLVLYYLMYGKSLDRILHNNFKELYGREGILVNFGRSAFEILIKKYNLENSEIIMPAYICGADNVFVNSLIKYNIKPVFVDADENFNCSVKEMKDKINKKTSAIMAAYIYGNLFELSELRKSCKDKGILLIENCAHAFGAKLDGEVMLFSLYKNMPNIGGGYLITKDKIEVELESDKIKLKEVKLLMSLFVNSFIYKIVKFFKKAKISEDFEGFSEIKEANWLVKLLFCYYYPKFKKNFRKQIEIGEYMRDKLNEKRIKVQDCKSVYSFFSLLVENREYVINELRKKGILATETWFKPIVLNEKAVKTWRLDKKEYKNSVEISEKVINLPVHFYYKKKDADYIVESLVEIVKGWMPKI